MDVDETTERLVLNWAEQALVRCDAAMERGKHDVPVGQDGDMCEQMLREANRLHMCRQGTKKGTRSTLQFLGLVVQTMLKERHGTPHDFSGTNYPPSASLPLPAHMLKQLKPRPSLLQHLRSLKALYLCVLIRDHLILQVASIHHRHKQDRSPRRDSASLASDVKAS